MLWLYDDATDDVGNDFVDAELSLDLRDLEELFLLNPFIIIHCHRK